jgi:hypothetical protein
MSTEVRATDLHGPWCLVSVAQEAYLLPVQAFRRWPATYAWVLVNGYVRAWLSEEEGLEAMAGCRDIRMGRGN